jgi:2'-5' RNA ligase
VELSVKARSAVSDVITCIPKSEFKNLRAVRPETVHLTLKFLGNVSSEQISGLLEALKPVAGIPTWQFLSHHFRMKGG